LWLAQAIVAARAAPGSPEDDFYRGKQQACRYFFRYELARVPERLHLLAQGDDTCLTMSNAWF